MQDRLCIIVPTLNSFKHLSKLIQGLKEQSKQKDWRVIFVDGNSCKEHKDYLKQVTSEDSRFAVIDQSQSGKGIFGAMNDGWGKASEDEWTVFWGSDDWPTNEYCVERILCTINTRDAKRALLTVFRGKYVNKKGRILRIAKFTNEGESSYIKASEFRNFIINGLTPPHQATIFSPKLREYRYDDEFKLCADLDIFLRLSKRKDANIVNIEQDIITMQNGGISNQMTIRRLGEVAKAYQKGLGKRWKKTILARYINKIKTRVKRNQQV